MNPKVSIIIPCFNSAPWLQKTLASALEQEWLNKEIIVVDDGSCDNSVSITKGFKDAGVRLIAQQHKGASAARNRGLAASNGDYIQFLDADDVMSPNKISSQLELLGNRPRDTVASCTWMRLKGNTKITPPSHAAVFCNFSPGSDFLTISANTGAMMQPAAWLTPIGIIRAAGPWNEELTLDDDGEYFARVLLRAHSIAFSKRGIVYWRTDNSNSLSKQKSAAALTSHFTATLLFEKHLFSTGHSRPNIIAMARCWSRTRIFLYPGDKCLSRMAEKKARALGGVVNRDDLGATTKILAIVFGWKLARRMQILRLALSDQTAPTGSAETCNKTRPRKDLPPHQRG